MPQETPNTSHTLATERLQLAIYVHATARLLFLGCELGDKGKVRFLFEDPERRGSQIELDYDRGAEVAGTALFASQKFLRRTMSEALNKRRIGKTDHDSNTKCSSQQSTINR